MTAAFRLPAPAPVPDAAAITSAAADLVERAERSERPTVRPPVFRPVTTAMREAMSALARLDVFVRWGWTASHGRTVLRVEVSGRNTYPLRAMLERWGFALQHRKWVTYDDCDLTVLLPLLVREHDAHESASQRRVS